MKKYVAFVVAVMLICTFALAETCAIPQSSLTLTLPDGYETYEVDSEDAEDGVVLHVGSSDSSVEMYIYAYENDGWTIEDLAESFVEADGEEQAGQTEINGITVAYDIYADEGMTLVEYEAISGDNIIEIVFTAGGDTDAAKSIMETLVTA